MRRFASIELISDRISVETTILTFHHSLEKHEPPVSGKMSPL